MKIILTLWAALWVAATAALAQGPYGITGRPAFPAYMGTMPASAPTFSGTWTAVPAFDNITFLNPMGLAPIPGTNRLMVWEREGRIYTFENTPAVSTRTLVLNLSNQTQGWDDSGLMGIAFHPNFASNGYVFVYYTWVTPGTVQGSATARPPTNTPNRNRLSRFTWNFATQTFNAAETIFIDQISTTVWHEGGGMFFHPDDGFLYLTIGDDANDVNSQRINTSLHSGVLRIDVDRRGGSISHAPPKAPLPAGSVAQNYFIPNDNPFVGQTGVLEEFWALGLRSPHRMTFDPVSKRIFIGDVGGGSKEEISVAEPTDPFGLNFQWSRIEGVGGDLTPPYSGVNKRPILDYPRTDGRAVIGGYVYRGTEFASDLAGKYIFGDNITNTVWYLNESTTPPSKVAICTVPKGTGPNAGSDYVGISSFGVDANNELYICQLSSIGGKIYKFSRTGPPPVALPATLSATGAFSNLATLAPRSGLIPYLPNSPLWSDRADKTRYMGIPDGQTIAFAPSGEWTFPAGSVWVKHFDLPINDADPTQKKRLETRLLVRNDSGYVYGATYRWRADNSNADLVESAQTANIAITGTDPIGPLTSVDLGAPVAGSTVKTLDGWEVTGGGADIWGTSDSFRFAHELRTGDFEVTTRVESLSEADLYTKAGLMVRESLTADSRHVMALVFPGNAARNNNVGGYEFQSRDTTGGASTALYPPTPQPRVSYPNTWLRLQRTGNTFTAYAGSDGQAWSLFATKTLVLPGTVYVGLAVTAHTASGVTATAQFHFPNSDRVQPWFFPGRSDCVTCHTTASGGVLGVNTPQSNRTFAYPSTGVADNQLRAWNHIGLFSTALDENAIPGWQRLVSLSETTEPLENRARSYLDSNCSHCHRPGGVNSFWDGRIETSLAASGIINGTVQNTLGVSGGKVLVPQDVTRSIMHKRLSTATEPYKMPPLAKALVDDRAVATLAAWINSLTPPPTETLPPPWLHQDIGPVALAGDASFASGNFNLSASGADIWDAQDSFHYVYRSLQGDGEITARIGNVSPSDPWAKSGVMIRESLADNSAHAFIAITSGQGAAFQRRLTAGANSVHTAGPNIAAPYWVRLTRQGNLFTASVSDVGDTWTPIGTETIVLGQQIYIGLALTAHTNIQIATSTVSSVNVTGGVSGVSAKINFQLAGAPVPAGYLEDGGAVFGSRGNGFSYGWNQDNTANQRDRNNPAAPDQRYDTLAHFQKPGGPWIWEIALPNGRYSVRAIGGDPSNGDGNHHLTAEGVTLFDGPQPGGPNTYLDGSAEATVTDGRLTFVAGANGVNTKVCFVEITPVLSGVSVALTAPANGAGFSAPATLGLSATASASVGSVTKVEFFNGPTKLGEDTTAPYTLTWAAVPAGTYALTAKATNTGSETATSAVSTVTITEPGSNGLYGEYFPTMTLSGTPVPRYDATVNFDWGNGAPLAGIGADGFSVRWSGRVQATLTGNHIFTTESDDGVRLRIGGALVIDKWVDQGPTLWNSGPLPLTAGQFYDVEMEYYENGGGALARLLWTPPGGSPVIIPTARLAPPAGGNRPPRAGVFTEPVADGTQVNPDDVHLVVTGFSDPNPGDTHVSSDWEIWTLSPSQRIWAAADIGGTQKLAIQLGDGVFENSHAGRSGLLHSTSYSARVRFRDSSGAPATEWGGWATRNFVTTSVLDPIPGAPGWIARQPDYKVELVAQNLQLPVNVAFVATPGPNPTDILCYVAELYGTIKTITRNGTVSDYATGLLNFNPTGNFPGSGEQGLAGLVVNPATGDVFASMLYSSVNGVENAPHYPKVVRFTSTDGGRTAATRTSILDMTGESMGQSHQVSNLTIGPDNMLYLHMGDGFDSSTAQNPDSYRGKILRFTLAGAAPTDNPFYSAANGINARDYVFAYGLRNPFGGDWRTSDAAHYEVENGPSVDRICKIVRGRNYLWDGSDASMTNFALWNWNPAVGPVNLAFIQNPRFGGSGFPAGKMDRMFISESGATWGTGPQANGKRISEFEVDGLGNRVSGPTPLIEYNGTGKATVCGLAAGPDGLYFTDLYKDQNYVSPVDRGANLLRVRYAPPIPWNRWREARFTIPQLGEPTISGENADPDSDGIVNLVEYALGLDPWQPSQSGLLNLTQAGNVITVIYNHALNATDVQLHLQVSTALTGWHSTGVTEEVIGTTAQLETIRARYTVPGGTTRLFLRVNAVK